MAKNIFHITPFIAAAALGALIPLASISSAATAVAAAPSAPMSALAGGSGTNPLLPYGPNPQAPAGSGYINDNHDEIDTSGGQVDLPF